MRILAVAGGSRDPFDVEVEADDNLVVVGRGLKAVVRVKPVSGDRTIL